MYWNALHKEHVCVGWVSIALIARHITKQMCTAKIGLFVVAYALTVSVKNLIRNMC